MMRILVVEDYDFLRDSICQGLREAGFAVDEASDGESGLWRASTNPYDVIILDLMLPKMDGLSVLAALRNKNISTHVLVLTAKDTTPDRIKGLNAGADDYLVKPFDFAELLARVRALVRREYKSKNPTLSVEDLLIDTTARTAKRSGESIELTPREYALLEFLAIRQGQVVTRTEIWEHVYDFNANASSNVVDVFIGHLRKKIERPGLSRLIHTRRGHGYVLGGGITAEEEMA
jgi:DNA-binding response OmpR family regulator